MIHEQLILQVRQQRLHSCTLGQRATDRQPFGAVVHVFSCLAAHGARRFVPVAVAIVFMRRS
ncbi:hypothetical protein CF640_36360 [Burkholderia pseudomallei]|nr:hypothetical protein CF640_36360 [Burkholderia pseudomallei]